MAKSGILPDQLSRSKFLIFETFGGHSGVPYWAMENPCSQP